MRYSLEPHYRNEVTDMFKDITDMFKDKDLCLLLEI